MSQISTYNKGLNELRKNTHYVIHEHETDLSKYHNHISLNTITCDTSCTDKFTDGQQVTEGIDYRLMDSNKWYRCECDKCGWSDSSEFASGGGQIADTGDYGDCVCPVCHNQDVDADLDSNSGIVAIPISKGNQEMKIENSIW